MPVKASRRVPTTYRLRWKALRRRMRVRGLDALLISHPPDIRYLCGFCGEDSWALLTRRSMVVLSDSRFEQELVETCPFVKHVIRRDTLPNALKAQVDRLNIRKIGVQADHMIVRNRRALAGAVGARRLTDLSGWLVTQRAVKSRDEIKALRRAIRVQEQAYRQTIAEIRPGQTEREIAAMLDHRMRLLGADGPSFPTIVATGPNAAKPHHVPGTRRVGRHGALLIDFGARVDGYCGDLTRVVFFGKGPSRILKIYAVVLEAQRAAIRAIAPGKSLAEIDAVARQVITEAGYGHHFGHSLGHGIGLEVHEQPSLSAKAQGYLETGQVVTVEPGIYLPGVGGVRIEDDVLLTASGHRVLSTLPTDLESAMI